MNAAAAVLLITTLSAPLGQWTSVQLDGATAAWSADAAVAEASAHDGVLLILGKSAGRTRVVVESAGGVSEVEVAILAPGEERTGDDVRTAVIELATGRKTVRYSAIDGLAIFEGDVILGAVDELAPESFNRPATQGTAISGSAYRWPDGTIPYTIDPALPDAARVTAAIAHWEQKTTFRFVPRAGERDYVTFRAGMNCSSMVGRRGGQQLVLLGADCGTGNVIHEIGHVIGLWHEQSREDRDRFVRIDFTKIRADSVHNFDQHVTDGDDAGAYDYGSIMHYPRNAFSIDGSDTIVALDPRTSIGQREELSAGDVTAANALCTCAADPIVSAARTRTRGKRRSVGGRG